MTLTPESVDLADLWLRIKLPQEDKSAVWSRLEAVLWYNAHIERGLLLKSLDRDEFEAVYEVIVIHNATRKPHELTTENNRSEPNL